MKDKLKTGSLGSMPKEKVENWFVIVKRKKRKEQRKQQKNRRDNQEEREYVLRKQKETD